MSKLPPKPVYELTDEQQGHLDWLLETPRACLALDAGDGKTIVALALKEVLSAKKVLAVAPPNIIDEMWSKHLIYHPEIEIYSVNQTHLIPKRARYDLIINDETQHFKHQSSRRTQDWLKTRHMSEFVVNLTGTLTSNSIEGLFTQIFYLDEGLRAGRTLTEFRNRWMHAKQRGGFTQWVTSEQRSEQLFSAIGDIVRTSRGNAKVGIEKRELGLDYVISKEAEQLLKQYRIGSLTKINYMGLKKAGFDPRAMLAKLKQALDLCGGRAIIAFNYYYEREVVAEWLGASKLNYVEYSQNSGFNADAFEIWNRRQSSILLVSASAIAGGLNLHYGGSSIIFTSPTDYDRYTQVSHRIYRIGQTEDVKFITLVARLEKGVSVEQKTLENLQIRRKTAMLLKEVNLANQG